MLHIAIQHGIHVEQETVGNNRLQEHTPHYHLGTICQLLIVRTHQLAQLASQGIVSVDRTCRDGWEEGYIEHVGGQMMLCLILISVNIEEITQCLKGEERDTQWHYEGMVR